MTTSTITRVRRLLVAGGLALAACAAFLTPSAQFNPQARPAPPAAAQTPAPTPEWRPPTRPDAKYVCDWKLPFAQGMGDVRLEYTRQLPQNGWLGKMHTRYADGTTRTQLIQLFAPRLIPRVGTEWSFQTTDGKVRCKMTVMRGSGEVRLGSCSNKLEQYCVDQRLLDTVNGLPGPDCAQCRTQGVFNRVACVTRCLARATGRPTDRGCPYGWNETPDPRAINNRLDGSSVACMTITYWMTVQRQSGYEGDYLRDQVTQAGLDELLNVWRDFVNGALGPCTSSHLCPAGTACVGGSCEDWTKLVK